MLPFNFSLEDLIPHLLLQIFAYDCARVDRLKKQELLSCAQSAEHAMRTFEESGKRDLSASLQFSLDSVAEPQSKLASNPPCERAKIIISIQDKDGPKNFRVYMVYTSVQKVCLN